MNIPAKRQDRELAPLVSVVIPTYNRAHVLNRAIESVLAQTYSNFELIIVDDASTDNTIELVDQFQDDRIVLMKHKNNQHAAAARNTGMQVARGQYIAFLDSDDEWIEEKLAKQINLMESLGDAYGAVHSSASIYKDGSNHAIYSRAEGEGAALKPYIVGDFVIWTPTVLFRRECLGVVGLMDTSLQRSQDRDFYIRLLKHYQIAKIDEALASIHLTTSKSISNIALASRITLLQKHEDTLLQLGWTVRRKAFSRQWLLQAEEFAVEGKKKEGLRYFLKALCLWPFGPLRRHMAFTYKFIFN